MFSKLCYPISLVESTIKKFSQDQTKNQVPLTANENERSPVYLKIPYKDQTSANKVRRNLNSLSCKINVNIKAVLTSKKLAEILSTKKKKTPIVNNQRIVYRFQCDLCGASYVGYTARHLHQRVAEHKRSAIGKHLASEHNRDNAFPIHHLFKTLKKCKNK